ncbi:MAG: hypothetical protein WCF67_03025 [Chitinophagaceae bacterium]
MRTYILTAFILCMAAFISPLHAQMASKIVTDKIPGSDCNNTAIDQFTGTQNRSATPCEIELDKRIRTAFRKAFAKLIDNWPAEEWTHANSSMDYKPIAAMGRESERSFFNPAFSDVSVFYLELNLNPASPAYSKLYEEYTSLQNEMLSKPSEAATKKFFDWNYRARSSTSIRIRTMVNNVSYGMTIFKGGSKPVNIPGAAYAVRASNVAPETGGDITESMDACLIVFGKVQPKVTNEQDGSQGIKVTNEFPQKTSRLTVQHVMIRIECNPELLDRVLKDVDWSLIYELVKK